VRTSPIACPALDRLPRIALARNRVAPGPIVEIRELPQRPSIRTGSEGLSRTTDSKGIEQLEARFKVSIIESQDDPNGTLATRVAAPASIMKAGRTLPIARQSIFRCVTHSTAKRISSAAFPKPNFSLMRARCVSMVFTLK
jgi:hypothetical protein